MSISIDSFADALCKGHDVEGKIKEQVRRGGWTTKVAEGAKRARHDNAMGNTLATMIEGEILPRLLLTHQHPDYYQDQVRGDAGAAARFGAETFAQRTLTWTTKDLLAEVDGYVDAGAGWEAICLDLLAPAARVLGVWWEEDRCSFAEVTIGLGRLHQVLHTVVQRAAHHRRHHLAGRRAFFAPAPGEQHVFGLVMLQEFFEADGWLTDSALAVTSDDVLEAVSSEPLDLVGLTAACVEHLDTLPGLIKSVRKVSLNPNIVIMVGGRLFPTGSDLAQRLGANASAPDGRLAVDVASALVKEPACAAHNS